MVQQNILTVIKGFIPLALSTALCTSAYALQNAGDDLNSLSLDDLLDLKVSVASNIISDVTKQPVSVTAITREKISLSGARTLNELLTLYIPGYFLVEDQDDTIAGFRGLVPDNNSKVMLLLNGKNLNTEWFWGPPDAILNGIDLGYIERVEVIRGPGSVTLGQGALLGVINIVTKKGKLDQVKMEVSTGADGLSKRSISMQYNKGDTAAYFYTSSGHYQGNPMSEQGWTSARSEEGLSVYQRQHHLHRSDYNNTVTHFKYKHFETNLFRFQQQRDLYNFFRDREAVQQTLEGIGVSYQTPLSDNIQLTLSSKYLKDDYALYTHGGNIEAASRLEYESNGSGFSDIIASMPGLADARVESGLTMGGTRETRIGYETLFNWNNFLSSNNKAALGFEYNQYRSGHKDSRGNNFIINEEIQRIGLSADDQGNIIAAGSVNDNNTWVKPSDYAIKSAFFENVFQMNQQLDLFAAFRWDSHPNWGSHFSPRLGGFYALSEKHQFRLTWQTGFRGAVGVQFSGGFVQDGFLAEENFAAVNAIATTAADFDFDGIAANDSNQLKTVDPETIESLELAYAYQTSELYFNGVVFFNTVEDILAAQAHGYEGLAFGDTIGTDAIGTWNGNWYYQNQDGKLQQLGLELELDYQVGNWLIGISHAHVQVTSADAGTMGIYVLDSKHNAAYPEDVTRLHANYITNTSVGEFSFSFSDVWYWHYYAPTKNRVDGSHLANIGFALKPESNPNMSLKFLIKNIFNSDTLYPINGTGDLAGADGTPSIEARTWWMNVNYRF